MRDSLLLGMAASLLLAGSVLSAPAATDENAANTLILSVDQANKDTIAPEVYGHFAEHLVCNTFEKPALVEPKTFTAFKISGDHLRVTLPSKSVVAMEVE